jgi:hypothetical protein
MGTDLITSISYSTDNGETWITTANQNNKSEHLGIDVDIKNGDKIMWKGIATQTGFYDEDDYDEIVGSFFSSTCEFDVQGNVMSLLYGDNFKGETTIKEDYAFCRLFNDFDGVDDCLIVNAKNLSLPATTLAQGCYYYMFINCTRLMTAPELPATTLANYCYWYMFSDCTRLTIAPELPATTLANSCYNNMFDGCKSLTTAPVLTATTLANGCYNGMFSGCRSLTTAPVLPATTLVSNCYRNMFRGCTNLNYIKAMFTTTPSDDYTRDWVNGVAVTGTFVKNSAATWEVTGVNGVPSGWTIETASE